MPGPPPEASEPSQKAPVTPSKSTAPNSNLPDSGLVTQTPIHDHLYDNGFLNGQYSDILIHCLGKSYRLHRILLERSPFFAAILPRPKIHGPDGGLTLYSAETDPNITTISFELALRRLYGGIDSLNEKSHATSLFATGCWLKMEDLIADSLTTIVNQISPANIAQCFKLASNKQYEKHVERLLVAIKGLLYLDGCEILVNDIVRNGGYLVDILPGKFLVEILSSDAFFVPREWHRWCVAKLVFNKKAEIAAKTRKLVDIRGLITYPRPDVDAATFRRQATSRNAVETVQQTSRWMEVYNAPDVAPLFDLFDQGIYYPNMTFEQLYAVKYEKDRFNILRLVRDDIISTALWQSLALRHKITDIATYKMKIGLARYAHDETLESPQQMCYSEDQCTSAQFAPTEGDINDAPGSNKSVQTGMQPVKHWIPVTNCRYLLDDMTGDAYAPIFNGKAQDYLVPVQAGEPQTLHANTNVQTKLKPSYTRCPPFRFSAEFPYKLAPGQDRQTFSHVAWYAGSFWEISVSQENHLNSNQPAAKVRRIDPAQVNESVRVASYANFTGMLRDDLSLTDDGLVLDADGNPIYQAMLRKTPVLPPYIDRRNVIGIYGRVYTSHRGKQSLERDVPASRNKSLQLIEYKPQYFTFKQVPPGSIGGTTAENLSDCTSSTQSSPLSRRNTRPILRLETNVPTGLSDDQNAAPSDPPIVDLTKNGVTAANTATAAGNGPVIRTARSLPLMVNTTPSGLSKKPSLGPTELSSSRNPANSIIGRPAAAEVHNRVKITVVIGII